MSGLITKTLNDEDNNTYTVSTVSRKMRVPHIEIDGDFIMKYDTAVFLGELGRFGGFKLPLLKILASQNVELDLQSFHDNIVEWITNSSPGDKSDPFPELVERLILTGWAQCEWVKDIYHHNKDLCLLYTATTRPIVKK